MDIAPTAKPAPSTEAAADRQRGPRGQGSIRQRRAGAWEVRMGVIAPDGSTRRVSRVVYGDAAAADRARRDLLAQSATGVPTPWLITLGQLLGLWVEADQPWKPSTLVGNLSLIHI